MLGGFHTTDNKQFSTPAGCPAIQLNSNATYPLEDNELKVWSYKTPPHFGCQSQIQIVTYSSDQTALDQKFQWSCLGFN